MKKHQKHANLTKPNSGKYHRVEFGFVGAPCGIIQELVLKLNESLSEKYRIGYMDADHGQAGIPEVFHARYTDKISHHQFTFTDDHIDYSLSGRFDVCDALFVNANHFVADSQIVLIHEKKRESLSRKLDRLTDVTAFVYTEGTTDIFDFLKDRIPNWETIPKIMLNDIVGLSELTQSQIDRRRPKLTGLVLAGGKSYRMGQDKSQITYHHKIQREHMADVLSEICEDVWLSAAPDQALDSEYHVLKDRFLGLGPYGGLLSAFMNDPNRAYLCVPCDAPFVDHAFLSQLTSERDISKLATCFHNVETGFPEPLITIWEPRAYSRLLHFLSLGHSCPRKVLINSDIKEIVPSDKKYLFNANTPEEFNLAMSELNKSII